MNQAKRTAETVLADAINALESAGFGVSTTSFDDSIELRVALTATLGNTTVRAEYVVPSEPIN